MVKKVYIRCRPCGNFLRLNLETEPDFYPLPNMLDFTAKAAGCIVFSKIDLQEGVSSDHCQPKGCAKNTAITTRFGLLKYKRVPFGLRNMGLSFQRHVDMAVRVCHAAFAWVDDTVICSRNH
jgi:hypothetical protein